MSALKQFEFSFVLVVRVSRAAAELDNIGIIKAATKVFRVLPDNSFALGSFLSLKRFKSLAARFVENYRDEARHGKAFEGLLKRYFN